jgi:hypothetical protein
VIDPRQVRKARAEQIQLPKTELNRLALRIAEDYMNAQSDHDARMRRFQSYYLRWRGRTEEVNAGEFRVPITQWQTFSKWAKEMSSLFGEDSEVVAKPVGPNDQRITRKIARFATWRLFDSMRIQNPATVFVFRKILFGRSVAYAPWQRDTYWVPLESGDEQEAVSYEGPGFFPQWPDDIIVPAEEVESIHDFSFVIRKYRATPDQLLRGEDAGIYQGIKANFEQIINASTQRQRRDAYEERVKHEKDLAEGVTYEGSLSATNQLVIHEWYGRWRRLKGKQDATEHNLARRNPYESDLVIRFIPDLQLVVGVQDLADMYPTKAKRRPFVESALVKDGSYWGPSFGELLETIEAELSSNHGMASRAGKLSVGPVIFYKPASGFDPDTFEYEPGMSIASDDPNGVNVIALKADLQYPVVKEQTVIGYGERVTGISDMNMGRSSDRPNAPRTARQTLALLEEGDVRASLDMNVLREDWGEIIAHFWELEGMYGSPNLFFRVTEEDAGGLFEIERGGSYLTEEDRTHRYDFSLKFATNAWSKETQKQNQLALYQIDLQNPLVVQNPHALWLLLDKIHRAFGDDRFADVIPQPPDSGLPVPPREEWTRCLQGEEIRINPVDNDELHIMDHQRRIEQFAKTANYNEQAYNEMVAHILEHTQQIKQKQLMAALVDKMAQTLGPAVMAQQQQQMMMQPQGGGGAGQPQPQAGMPPGMPLAA